MFPDDKFSSINNASDSTAYLFNFDIFLGMNIMKTIKLPSRKDPGQGSSCFFLQAKASGGTFFFLTLPLDPVITLPLEGRNSFTKDLSGISCFQGVIERSPKFSLAVSCMCSMDSKPLREGLQEAVWNSVVPGYCAGTSSAIAPTHTTLQDLAVEQSLRIAPSSVVSGQQLPHRRKKDMACRESLLSSG